MEHTAEHVLMGSLQRIKGGLKVRKVEFSQGEGSALVEVDSLSFEEIAEMQSTANRVIAEGREVREHFFNSLEDAKRAFPSLRAREERIHGRVRVVEVDGFDYSACSGEHVGNTKECGMIIVTHVSKSGGLYELRFAVGEKALEVASRLSALCLSVSAILGTPVRNLEKTALNMRMENEDLRRRLSAVTETMVEKAPLIFESNGMRVYGGILEGIDVKTTMKKIGELVKKERSIYVIGVEWFGSFNIVVGSGEERINAAEVIREAARLFNGKGGGDQRIAVGSFPEGSCLKAFEAVKTRVSSLLS
ncbi:MAG: hypothetical protein ACUVQ0_03580 [Thermoproteota archaeon]